jgi:hypothetical protein
MNSGDGMMVVRNASGRWGSSVRHRMRGSLLTRSVATAQRKVGNFVQATFESKKSKNMLWQHLEQS